MTVLIAIHVVQNHAPSNLNRDDTGTPKTCMFGGFPRARVSSQCLKRTIRQSEFFQRLMEELDVKSFRTRQLPDLIFSGLVAQGVPKEKARSIAERMQSVGKSDKSDGKNDSEGDDKESTKPKKKEKEPTKEEKRIETKQVMFVSDKEIQKIIDVFKKNIDGWIGKVKKDFQKDLAKEVKDIKTSHVTPDMSLFGRMVTSDVFADIEASMQVANAISTNAIETELDFFTAVDDLLPKDASGAGMVGEIEFNSACFYKYFSLDTDEFLQNMANGEKDLTKYKGILKKTVEAFLKAVIYVSPSGKQNTFAAHQLPDAIYVEVKDHKIPVSHANAFVKPCTPIGMNDLVTVTIDRFKEHVEMVASKFNVPVKNAFWFTTRDVAIKDAEPCDTVNALIDGVTKVLA